MPIDELLLKFKDFDATVVKALYGLVYLLGAAMLSAMTTFILRRFRRYWMNLMRERKGVENIELEKQTRTLANLLRRILLIIIWVVAIGLALGHFGFNVAPLLAGAGVAGIAVGFAAQSILKDWINGFFLLTEGQLRINDLVKIGDVTGAVEKMTLRTTALRGFDGALHVIANGAIQTFSNLSLLFSYYALEINVDYGDDPKRMMDLMLQVDDELRRDPGFGPLILEPLEIAGVDKFLEAGIVIKVRLKTVPSQQWVVGREFNRRLERRCREAGVRIATARREVQIPGSPDPAARREMKELIREVMREEQGA